MKISIANGLVGFKGKESEFSKMEAATVALSEFMNIDMGCGFGDDETETAQMFDTDEYTQEDVRRIWSQNKKSIMASI